MPRVVSHLEGAIDGTRLDPDALHTLHKDRPIWVRYDLAAVARELTKEKLKPNAVKIPNICEHFMVPYLDLEGFMEKEDWTF